MSNNQINKKRSSKRLVTNKDVANSSTEISVEFGPKEDGLTYPDPAPPISKKSDIYSADDFTEVESHVRQTPLDASEDYETLLEYLLKDFDQDLKKLISIFCWIVQQKIPLLLCKKDIPPPDTPVGYLHAIRMKRGTYANLFAELCRKARLPCVVIHGIAKGVYYQVGDKIDKEKMKTSWNAVFIDGNWRLVHPYWSLMSSQGYETGLWAKVDGSDCHSTHRELSRSYIISSFINESYFLSDPEIFIYKCFPNDKKWQLMDDPISISTFETNLFLQPCFFKLDLKIVQPKTCKIICTDGLVEIVIQMPDSLKSRLRFSYNLFRKRSQNDEGEYEFPSMNKFVLHYYAKNTTIFEIRFPPTGVGSYIMQIFCIDLNSEIISSVNWICDFRIVCKSGMDECIPLPLVPEIGWGPKTEILKKHNMVALSEKAGKLSIDKSLITEFKFRVNQDDDIHAELCQQFKSKSELSNSVKVVRQDSEVVVKVRPPQEGEYVLQIYHKAKGVLGYENVCNYVLQRNFVVEDQNKSETRKKLMDALDSGSVENIKAAVTEFESKGLKDRGEYKKAKRKLELARLNKELKEAIAAKDLDKLDTTMHNLSETSLKKELGELYNDASVLRSRLRKLKRLRHAVLEMDQKTISELRSYPKPPKPVHGVMAATFLLLGHKETDLKKWSKIQSLISKKGKEGLKRKVANIDMKKVKHGNVTQAESMLSKYTLESVQIASSGAATFYQWATSMISEYKQE